MDLLPMSACNCLEIVRANLEKQHGEGSEVELELATVLIIDPKADNYDTTTALPPLYYTYKLDKKRKKSHVVFNFCPFCDRTHIFPKWEDGNPMIEPCYSAGGIEIYHGECEQVMPQGGGRKQNE